MVIFVYLFIYIVLESAMKSKNALMFVDLSALRILRRFLCES